MRSLLSPFAFLALFSAFLLSCGEDRSSEQPFAPVVHSLCALVVGDSALLTGYVSESVNSSLKSCGFSYGNDTLRASCEAPEPAETFTAVTDSLGAGVYFAVAFAKNGVGTSYGDTIYFVMP